jgi:hypothetical protein
MNAIFAFVEIVAFFATIVALIEFGPSFLGRAIDRIGDWLAGIEHTPVAQAPSNVRKIAR